MSSEKYTGKVKWFNHKRGFGFIENLDEKEDIFVHQSQLRPLSNVFRTLYEGEYVEFSKKEDENKKVNAINVTGIKGNTLMCETKINKHHENEESKE